MALPTYDKTKRRKQFEILPKGAYVVKIMNAKEAENKTGGTRLDVAFDIAEGEYKDFYMKQYRANSAEDKKWPNDAIFRINVPNDSSPSYSWDNWNTFFADLEDSNNGFVFSGNVAALKDKVIGGKFHNEQTEYNGTVYDHTRLRWTCVADDVRSGKPGKMPNDKLIDSSRRRVDSASVSAGSDDFMSVPEGANEDIPWD